MLIIPVPRATPALSALSDPESPFLERRRDVQTTVASALLLPPPLAADLGKHSRTEVGTGESDATVLRFERPSAPTLYLKSRAVAGGARPLFDEAERLGWMHAVGLPVP